MWDLPEEALFKRMVDDFINDDLPRSIEDLEKLVLRNRIFMDRTMGIGVMSKKEAIEWSLTGPMARASGVARDVRKDEPYLCYADNWDGQGASAVKFKVPIAEAGDVYARFCVRIAEIRESVQILNQLIDDIPGRPMDTVSDGEPGRARKADVYG